MSDSQLRADVARRLMRALRSPQREIGERALGSYIVALASDTVGELCRRVAAAGGTGHVVAAIGSDLHILTWTAVGPTDTPIYDGVDDMQAVDPGTHISMLLELVNLRPDGSHAFRVEEHCRVRLTEAERLMAPA